MRIIAVIPARYGSTRLPGKPLLPLCGKPVIQHVYERARQATLLDDVIVATDDRRIGAAVDAFGGKWRMTSPDCASGSDRLLELAAREAADVYLNIQGDEPLLAPAAVDLLARAMQADTPPAVCTLCHPISAVEAGDPNRVKVVRDARGDALYFSRAAIPFDRDAGGNAAYFAHIGIYAYTAASLSRFGALPVSSLERVEKLEQLRLLEAGIRIRVLETEAFGPGVDTAADLEAVRRILGDPAAGPVGSSRDAALRDIRLVITDVDGVLTDGGLYYAADGESCKRFHVRDGLGVKLLQRAGVRVAVLSGRDCQALRRRLDDLGIDLAATGRDDKVAACGLLMRQAGVSAQQTLFIGDDLPDVAAFALCRLGVTVPDATAAVRDRADWVLATRGGAGAFRELADAILQAQTGENAPAAGDDHGN